MPESIYKRLHEIENSTTKAVLCTIINTKGSTPRKTGSKMIVLESGLIYGSIGGGSLEKKVIEEALECIKTKSTKIVTHNLVSELAMCCGGTVELFLEPIMNKKHLYIFGAGHIGKALSKFASELDFNVTLIDERYDAFNEPQTYTGQSMQEHHLSAIEKLNFNENVFVVILTHDHQYDREILAITTQKKHAYIGMIGSERKVEIAKKNMLSFNAIDKKVLEKVDMPIGINIHAVTPCEIAISILAKLIDVRNNSEARQ